MMTQQNFVPKLYISRGCETSSAEIIDEESESSNGIIVILSLMSSACNLQKWGVDILR